MPRRGAVPAVIKPNKTGRKALIGMLEALQGSKADVLFWEMVQADPIERRDQL